jgi:ribosomal protein S17E
MYTVYQSIAKPTAGELRNLISGYVRRIEKASPAVTERSVPGNLR